MDPSLQTIIAFLESVHPYDTLSRDELARVAGSFSRREYASGEEVYHSGEPLKGLYLVKRGSVEVLEPSGGLVSLLGPRNSFGERGLLRDGLAVTTARVTEDAVILILPTAEFRRLIGEAPAFERFFNRGRGAEARGADLTTQKVANLMVRDPITVAASATIRDAALRMREAHVSSLGVTEGEAFVGIVTTRDMTNKALALGMDPAGPVSGIMTADPVTLAPDALG